MNDFTKEELEFLKWNVRQAAKHNPPIKGSTYVDGFAIMIRKIQSLINNYCEHTHKDYSVGDTRPIAMTHECLKCGKDFAYD
jgi:hypothetical protein